MTFDFDALSENFKKFYDAFSPEAYERSMGRSAEYYSVLEFSNLTDEEKSLISEWFLELFQEEKDYYGSPYLWVVENLNDTRFIPLIQSYYKRLKKRHKKVLPIRIEGNVLKIRSDFTIELNECRKVIKTLKTKKK